jgi:hypothetical protein
MNNKLIRLFVALTLLALPALVQAQFTYTTNSGAITITGYTGGGGAVVISTTINGYPVTAIGDTAFNDQTNITSVMIPNSVTNIGSGTFWSCSRLTDITVDAANPAYSSLNGVLFDNSQATLLQFPGGLGGDYTIPGDVTSIGAWAFSVCTSLTNVTIPNSVTNIGERAFDRCYGLTKVTIPNSVADIGAFAFYDCYRLASVAIPNSVTIIGDAAFDGCYGLTSVTIPNNVTNIGDYAFDSCSSLTSVTIPNRLTSIGNYAFDRCSGLTSVTIPNSVTNIGDYAFDSCSDLTNIVVTVGNPNYASAGGVLFDKLFHILIQYPGGLVGNYSIPNSVTTIGSAAFNSCSGLMSVTIPNSVTNISSYAFYGCSSLTSAYFQGNAPLVDGEAGSADTTVFFQDDTGTVYYYAGTTGWSSTFGGVPAVLWNPQATAMSVTSGQFGFTLTGPPNAVIVVEATTNLSHPVWLPVSTNILSGAGTSPFSDPAGYPMRFYRFRSF